MKTRLFPLTLIVILILLSIAWLAPTSAVAAWTAAETPEIEEETPTFDLRFEGGSLVDLVRKIEEQIGRPPNVIIGQKARDLEVPPFELYSVTVDDVFLAFTDYYGLSNASRANRVVATRKNDIWTIIIVEPAPIPDDPFAPGKPNAEPDAITKLFQVSPFLDVYDLDDLTTAIETYWNLAGVEEDAGLRFHEDTQLLFVRGTRQQVGIVEQVLHEIRPELDRLREERRARELMDARIETSLEAAQMEMDMAEVWVGELPEGDSGDQAGFWENRVDSLTSARDRLLEMRARLGDGHPALDEYLETLETQRAYVSRHRQRLMNLMESNRSDRAEERQRMDQLAEEILRRREQRQREAEVEENESESALEDAAENPTNR